MEKVKDLFLSISKEKEVWIQFLTALDLEMTNEEELESIDETIGILGQNGELLATGSVAGNVIKYVATCSEGENNSGERFNKIVTELSNRLAKRGIFHIFVFTKLKYVKSFGYLGFKELARAEQGALLEKGRPDISDFLTDIKDKVAVHQALLTDKTSCIVMNANPFTLGHRHLVETAALENDFVFVFVVSTERSLFRFEERLKLVTEGLSDLKNIIVLSGGEYMVSFATFPSYFIKTAEEVINFQTRIDAEIFKNWIAPKLGIRSRYLGEEPNSKTTDIYNQTLSKTLSSEIEVKIIERKSVDGRVISATAVRKAIADNQIEKLKSLVPTSTFDFIKEHLDELQKRRL